MPNPMPVAQARAGRLGGKWGFMGLGEFKAKMVAWYPMHLQALRFG